MLRLGRSSHLGRRLALIMAGPRSYLTIRFVKIFKKINFELNYYLSLTPFSADKPAISIFIGWPLSLAPFQDPKAAKSKLLTHQTNLPVYL